jgi:hypothetical protein
MPQLVLLLAANHLITTATAVEDLYSLDTAWEPEFPVGSHTLSAVGVSGPGATGCDPCPTPSVFVTQRGNFSVPPVLVLNATTGELLTAWGSLDIAPGGAHGLALECSVSDSNNNYGCSRVWIEDFTNHTLTAFSPSGKKLLQIGTPGVAGNGTDPIQFGSIADAYIVPPERRHTSVGPATVYATDGDGGSDNRVIAINVPTAPNPKSTTKWVTGHIFANPHSITMHEQSGLLVIADREHASLKLINSEDGNVLGEFDCGLKFGADHGVPFGVRTLVFEHLDLLFVAAMDNPQDHKHQRIYVLDVKELNKQDGIASKCSLLQTITIRPARYSGPHLLGVDPKTGNLYAALVADSPLSTVLRFKLNSA